MEDIRLEYRIKLKTGFFRSEVYILIISSESIKLVPENKVEGEILISFKKVKTISISSEAADEIEIRTENEMYVGTFWKSDNISMAVKLFNRILGKRFTYN